MGKRRNSGGGFFADPGPHDPFGRILTSGLNTGVNIALGHGAQWLDGKIRGKLGLNGMSAADEIKLNQSRAALKRQEAEVVRITVLGERQMQLYDLRIQEKQLAIEAARERIENAEAQSHQLALPVHTEVVSGALEVAADPRGLAGSPEQAEAYNRWLDSFQEGKVILICGRRGSGKSVLAAKMGEYMEATYRLPCYWVGLPDQARELIPSWIKIVDDPHKCPVNSFIITDEAGINFLSLAFNTDRNRYLRTLLMVARQRHCSLVFCVQSTSDVDISVVRQCDSLVFKQPGLHQPETERPNIRARARQASAAFSAMTKEEALESAYIFDDDFEGIIKSTPPSFWSEDLSHVYAHLDLAEIEQQAVRKNELQHTVANETHQLNEASLDAHILELKRQGIGINKIAKELGCSSWRVRQCLDSLTSNGNQRDL